MVGHKGSNIYNVGLSQTNLWHYYSWNAGHEPLTAEQREKLVNYAEEKDIPPENIREVLATGKV